MRKIRMISKNDGVVCGFFEKISSQRWVKLFMVWNLVNPLVSLYFWVENLQRLTMEQRAEERVKSK
jgi:hypothetical protein